MPAEMLDPWNEDGRDVSCFRLAFCQELETQGAKE